MKDTPWLDYRAQSLWLWNGARITFPAPGAAMLYNPGDNIVAIEPGEPTASLRRKYASACDDGEPPRIREIRYSITAEKTRTTPGGVFLFYHPISRAADVVLRCDRSRLFILQPDERPIFSKDFTLSDVTRGAIPSRRAVWQFHGYRHEH